LIAFNAVSAKKKGAKLTTEMINQLSFNTKKRVNKGIDNLGPFISFFRFNN